MDEKIVLHWLKKNLSPFRYKHTLSVARWAKELAKYHHENAEKAWLAGLFHDCAKEFNAKKLAQVVVNNKLSVPDKKVIFETKQFHLLHAYVSAHMARKEFGVKDKQILDAISCHTLGKEKMKPLEKILFVADFSAPDRGFSAARKIRQTARKNLSKAVKEVIRLKMIYVLKTGGHLHPLTFRLWNEVCSQ